MRAPHHCEVFLRCSALSESIPAALASRCSPDEEHLMTAMLNGPHATGSPRLREADCRIDDFDTVVRVMTKSADFPHAARVDHGVLVYEATALRSAIAASDGRDDVEAELVRALTDGPGIVVLEGAFDDVRPVDRATAAFDAMIADERAAGTAPGDHFAKPGANDRVWNALEKLALRDPSTFVDYYANDMIALVSRAWLGPAYQVTSQVNVVRPGGLAQDPHRDYHLGFLENDVVEQYPAHVHLLSPVLTLQGAVAHSDMPVESGPTMYLPYSHQYAPGYLAWRLPEFRAYFAEHHVQLPLSKGDAAFFNPALFHGAGTNVSADTQRMAAGVSDDLLANAIASAAEGYPFPTNLDLDQPIDGLTPLAQAELVHQAVDEGWEPARLEQGLDAYAARRRTDA